MVSPFNNEITQPSHPLGKSLIMKKIAIATATRAEYGILKPLIDLVHQDPDFELHLFVTGAHLSFNHGRTLEQIEADGFPIAKKIEILLSSDTAVAVSKAMGLAQFSFAEAFEELKPDVVVILGDRYEMLAIASVSLMFNIPIVHLHGGELTFGAIDDSIRHAITKMSSLHFTSTEIYRRRVIQMGESPGSVFNTGALGLDNINALKLLSREELENSLECQFKKKNFIITFHPETKGDAQVNQQLDELLNALDKQQETFLLFTGANADTNGSTINTVIQQYVATHSDKAAFFYSLGQLRYLSCLKHFDLMMGNSSSGVIESPSFKIPVVNIGDRQKGRIMARNIINSEICSEQISAAIDKCLSVSFKESLKEMASPYGDGKSAQRILKVLKSYSFPKQKEFFEVE